MKKLKKSVCKYCGKENNNGTNFCTRKCRITWIKEHNIKGAKKDDRKYENWLMSFGSNFDNTSCQKEE